MKYLFSVDDLYTDDNKLYTVEAEDEMAAKDHFIKAFFPLIQRVDFKGLANYLADGMDIVISSLGPTSQIKEL